MVPVEELAYLALRSLLRVGTAYLLSLVFGIAVGYIAGTDKRAERVLLPVLDVLQSVPILAFFPAAVFFFIAAFPGSSLGAELAAVFLIFTSQAWNLAFGVYESVKTTPHDLVDAADLLGLRGARRFRRLVLPAAAQRLVYNSIISWAGGWYFLTASEIISANRSNVVLPGLGAFLMQASQQGRVGDMLAALALLVALIVAFELLLWKPLQAWSLRFRYDAGPAQSVPVTPLQRVVEYVTERRRELARRITAGQPGPPLPPVPVAPLRERYAGALRALRILGAAALLAFSALLAGLLALAIANAVLRPPPPGALDIPLALLASTARLVLAYVLALGWTLPVAVYIGRHERAARILMPTAEVLASIPAIALFPVLVLLLVGATGGLDVPSVLLILTGMQWYLLFNLVAGVRALPADLRDAASLFGVRGWVAWKRVVIPGLLPSLLTGSLTAWGGGWNALIVAEYVDFGGTTYHAFGIGDLIDRATFSSPDPVLLVDAVLAMVVFIYVVNALVWKRLYRRALDRYRLEA
jgi:NitT/TauT family transport system permease protein